jgi:hypothetical protein
MELWKTLHQIPTDFTYRRSSPENVSSFRTPTLMLFVSIFNRVPSAAYVEFKFTRFILRDYFNNINRTLRVITPTD